MAAEIVEALAACSPSVRDILKIWLLTVVDRLISKILVQDLSFLHPCHLIHRDNTIGIVLEKPNKIVVTIPLKSFIDNSTCLLSDTAIGLSNFAIRKNRFEKWAKVICICKW